MSGKGRDGDYLDHILDAVAKIDRFTAGMSEADFARDEIVQDAVIRNLEIVGEAVSKLGSDLKSRHGAVPWTDITGMRNRLIHGYFAVDIDIVWDTVKLVLPDFARKILEIRRGL